MGLAFKLEDGRNGQRTYMRIYQGTVSKGDFVVKINTQKRIRIPRIMRMQASEMHDVEAVVAGDIVALFGTEFSSGDTFTNGDVQYTMTSICDRPGSGSLLGNVRLLDLAALGHPGHR